MDQAARREETILSSRRILFLQKSVLRAPCQKCSQELEGGEGLPSQGSFKCALTSCSGGKTSPGPGQTDRASPSRSSSRPQGSSWRGGASLCGGAWLQEPGWLSGARPHAASSRLRQPSAGLARRTRTLRPFSHPFPALSSDGRGVNKAVTALTSEFTLV